MMSPIFSQSRLLVMPSCLLPAVTSVLPTVTVNMGRGAPAPAPHPRKSPCALPPPGWSPPGEGYKEPSPPGPLNPLLEHTWDPGIIYPAVPSPFPASLQPLSRVTLQEGRETSSVRPPRQGPGCCFWSLDVKLEHPHTISRLAR